MWGVKGLKASRVFTLLVALWALSLPLHAHAHEQPSGVDPASFEAFRSGLLALDRDKNYAIANARFEQAMPGLPFMADYLTYFQAKARLRAGDATGVLETLDTFKARHRSSPMLKDAMWLEVEALLQTSPDRAPDALNAYIAKYDDDKARLLLADYYQQHAAPDKAEALYLDLYVRAAPQDHLAFAKLNNKALSVQMTFKRASSLMEKYRYSEAEHLYRNLMRRNDGLPAPEVNEALALSLFKQKKYPEAASLYESVGDKYNAARAHLRSGAKERFAAILDEMIKSGHSKSDELLLSLAREKRQSKQYDEALSACDMALAKSTGSTEDALWERAWTLYMSKDYARAEEALRALNAKYPSNKHAYWLARSMDRGGKDASQAYKAINGEDFYRLMADHRMSITTVSATASAGAAFRPMSMPRVDVLAALGLDDLAVQELTHAALLTDRSDPSQALPFAYKLIELGQYRKAISMVSQLPKDSQPQEVMYPWAFGNDVKQAAALSELDPYLLLSLIREESRYDPVVESQAGAVGLMQLLPSTATRVAYKKGIKYSGATTLTSAQVNIAIGTAYFNDLMGEFRSVGPALAAYNAGEKKVRQWLFAGNYDQPDEFIEDIPFLETRNYVKRILASYARYCKGQSVAPAKQIASLL